MIGAVEFSLEKIWSAGHFLGMMLDSNWAVSLMLLKLSVHCIWSVLGRPTLGVHRKGDVSFLHFQFFSNQVHCCSQWGHDFRPDYKMLGILKKQFRNVPILGLTATANERVGVTVLFTIPLEYVLTLL